MKKRTFLKNLGALGMVPILPFTESDCSTISKISKLPVDFKNENTFWKTVRNQYALHPDFINLESGYYNIIPKPTLKHHFNHIQRINLEGSFYMRKHRFNDKDTITQSLAKLVGCDHKNLIITRNTTESLDLVISGFPWEKGDEAIFAVQDYGAMQNMFEQISKRYQVNLKKVSVPNHPINDNEIIALYKSQITSKTKLLMVSHMINITGQILPIKKICEMAHNHGVKVLVDGAHCIGHFDFNIEELNCDYYGSSLHKWLAVPLGVGLLYVNNNEISNLWPLMADNEKDPKKIKRLSHNGTIPVHSILAIQNAIEYLNWIGIERKEKRLQFLKSYWQNALKELPNIEINTPFDTSRSCGIGNVGIKNIKPSKLAKRLHEEFKIFTVAIDYANVKGYRITPNVFTTTKELDLFILAMKTIANA